MIDAPVQPTARAELVAPTHDELLERYAAYRRRQARDLVGLLPREAIRPLYRRALRDADPAVEARSQADEDPLAVLLDACEALLPLPTFEGWLEDVRRNPKAHLESLDRAADAPTAAAPTTLETRRFERTGRTWFARLRAFRDDDAWRGFIAFESTSREQVYRTSLIFRESSAAELRERFVGFDGATLDAFLRSALP